MDLAVKEHLTEHNPCRDVEVSRPRSAERTPLTLEEAISLCQALHGDELDDRRVAIWLALATSVRRGEALGLTWRYVDFDNMRVFIKYQYTENKALRETKNRRSRWIAIDDGTARYLRTWKAVQVGRMQVQGLSQTPNTPMCSDGDFGFHDPDNFSTWQRGYLIEHGLGRMEEAEEGGRKRRRYVGYDFHELRHTQATFLIGNGIDPRSAQGRLGHEVSSMTMDVYAHMMGGNDREAADLMGRLLRTGGGGQEAPGEEARANQAAGEPVRLTVVGPNPSSAPVPARSSSSARSCATAAPPGSRSGGSRRPRPPISWRSSAGRTRPSPSTGAGSPSWRGRLGADVATTKHTPSLTSEVIAAGPAGDKAQDDKMLSTQERPHL